MTISGVGRNAFGYVFTMFIALSVFFVSPCFADDKEKAKQKFLEGFNLVQEERYQEALESFEMSYLLVPKASVLFNIGMCQKALYRYADAIATFERFLSEAGEDVRPSLKEQAKEALVQLKILAGRLELRDAPPGASIEVNEDQFGTTPRAEPIYLDPGTYTLRVTKDGFEPLVTEITIVEGGLNTVSAALKPLAEDPTVPEPAKEEPQPKEKESKLAPLTVTGIALGGAGIAGIVVGIVFTTKYSTTKDDMEQAKQDYLDAPDEETAQPYRDKYNELKDDTLPKHKAGMIVGYAVGGALIVASATLIIVDLLKKDKKEKQTVSVKPTLGGVIVEF